MEAAQGQALAAGVHGLRGIGRGRARVAVLDQNHALRRHAPVLALVDLHPVGVGDYQANVRLRARHPQKLTASARGNLLGLADPQPADQDPLVGRIAGSPSARSSSRTRSASCTKSPASRSCVTMRLAGPGQARQQQAAALEAVRVHLPGSATRQSHNTSKACGLLS